VVVSAYRLGRDEDARSIRAEVDASAPDAIQQLPQRMRATRLVRGRKEQLLKPTARYAPPALQQEVEQRGKHVRSGRPDTDRPNLDDALA
jgi:hypothetical protein